MPNLLVAHPFAILALLIVAAGLAVALPAIFRKPYQLIHLRDIPKHLFGDTSTTLFTKMNVHLVESRKDALIWPGQLRVEAGDYMCHANERIVGSLPEHSSVNLMSAYILKNRTTGTSSLIIKGSISQANSKVQHKFIWFGATTRSSRPELAKEVSWNIKPRFWHPVEKDKSGVSSETLTRPDSEKDVKQSGPDSLLTL